MKKRRSKRHYTVDGGCGWFVVLAQTKREALSAGKAEFPGMVTAERSTQEDIDRYKMERRKIDEI